MLAIELANGKFPDNCAKITRMTEQKKKTPINMLTADELLRNKGIKYNVWDEFEKSVKTLPKTGKKEFEPNDSWLQNMQIEKGILTRKNLIAVERVDRISQLASAEWISEQKKARVKKYSGQDWGSFGLEKNNILYLIPEEALFLLEANCLELTWNDMPLSIQQAYDLLIDNISCTIEEYRVYSQLVRYGYRVQRFVYDTERNGKNDENVNVKRKVIVDPGKGLWMTDIQQENNTCTDAHNEKLDCQEKVNADVNDSDIEICQDVTKPATILDDVHTVVEELLSAVENAESHTNDECKGSTEKANEGRKKETGKVKIISDETLLTNIKIVTESTNNGSQGNNSTNWQTSRIKRNVKLLPKRTDKPLLPTDIPVVDSNSTSTENCLAKHKASSPPAEESHVKKSKLEVIELSDDEIQELPKPMSRMDLLNLIPNTASQLRVTVNISRNYIPNSIKPQKTVYHYESKKLRNLSETDRQLRPTENLEHSNYNASQSTFQCNMSTSTNARRNTNVLTYNHNYATNVYSSFMHNFFSIERRQYTHFDPFYMYNNRFPCMYSQNLYWQHRYLPPLTRNQYHQNFHQFSMSVQRFYIPPRNNHRCLKAPSNCNDEGYQSSFRILPGASSWSELKAKWREKKTITIDDEDTQTDENEDCNEVQIVQHLRNPLIGPKNADNLEEVFSKLRIIKSAPEKTVRRKKGRFKISYDVHSSTQNYRKANPGLPLYRIVVLRQDEPFVEPIELHRLQQDAKNSQIILACVSMSISYIQPGFISLPNLT